MSLNEYRNFGGAGVGGERDERADPVAGMPAGGNGVQTADRTDQ